MIGNKLLRDMIIYASTSALLKAGAIILIPLYTTYLLPEEYGLFALVSAIVGFLLPLMQGGLPNVLKRFWIDVEDDAVKGGSLIVTLIWPYLIWSSLVIGILFIADKWIIGTFIKSYANLRPYLHLAYLAIPLGFLFELWRDILLFQRKSLIFSSLNIGRFLFNIIGSVLFIAILGYGLVGVYWTMIIGELIFLIISIIGLRKYLSQRVDWTKLGEYLRYGIPLIPYTISIVSLNFVDRLLLQHWVSLSAIGIYSLGYSFGMGVNLPMRGFRQAFNPIFLRSAKRASESGTIKSFYLSYGKNSVILLLKQFMVVHLLYFMWIKELMLLLVRNDVFLEAYHIIPWIIAGFVFMALNTTVLNVLYFEKRTKYISTVTVISVVINILLNLYLIPIYGIYGAAISTTAAYAIRSTLIIIRVRFTEGVPLSLISIIRILSVGFLTLFGIYIYDSSNFSISWDIVLVKIFITLISVTWLWRRIKKLTIEWEAMGGGVPLSSDG